MGVSAGQQRRTSCALCACAMWENGGGLCVCATLPCALDRLRRVLAVCSGESRPVLCLCFCPFLSLET